MELKQCENGHFYSASEKYCPRCMADGLIYPENHIPEQVDDGEMSKVYAGPPIPEKNPYKSIENDEYRNIVEEPFLGLPAYEDMKQMWSLFLPVVGWLVCLDGPSKGADYRIHAGYNYIGRDSSMDICLPDTDQTVSHNKHAMIAFDPEECLFFFGPAEGKNIVKRNGKAVLSNVEIEDRDILTIGSCQFLFVMLCNDECSWER